MANEKADHAAILAAWDQWKTDSNNATDDMGCARAFKAFCDVLEPIAIANGRPPGRPTRKLG